MIDKRILMGGAAAVVLLVGGGVWVAIDSSDSSASVTRVQHPLAAEAYAALQAISTPSRASALPGSIGLGGGRYRIAGSCADVRTAYHAADAPIPAGATVTDSTAGMLFVSTAMATSAIIPQDSGDECAYLMTADATAEVTGDGPIPNVSGFIPVGCVPLFDEAWQGMEVFSAVGDAGQFTVMVGFPGELTADAPPASAYRALVSAGTPDDVNSALNESDEDSVIASGLATSYPVTLSSDSSGRIVAELGGEGTGQVIRLSCTTGYTSMFPHAWD